MNETLKTRPELKNNKEQVSKQKTEEKKQQSQSKNNETSIVQKIEKLSSLREYRIRDLVNDSKDLGEYLKEQNVETNQIRKFLDAINRLKFNLSRKDEEIDIQVIESDLVMLKPKLAYAVARVSDKQKRGIEKLNKVISQAIDKIEELKQKENLKDFRADFERLVQLIESIIAYHKYARGK